MRDYAQESGRAGRDGKSSEGIIVREVQHDRRGMPVAETAEKAAARGLEREMWEFMETKGCVRVVLDREMEGVTGRVARKGRRGEEQVIDRLQEEEDRPRSGREQAAAAVEDELQMYQGRVQRRMWVEEERTRQKEVLEVVELQEAFEKWAEGCAWSRVTGEGEER